MKKDKRKEELGTYVPLNFMKKKILITIVAVMAILSLSACKKEDWNKVEEMGEVNIDPNDTESLAPPSTESTEDDTSKIGTSYDKDLIELVEKEENENHIIMIHECNFRAARDVVSVKGTLHNLTDNHEKIITLEILDKKGNTISSSEVNMDEDSPDDPSFAIESKLTLEDVDNVKSIKVSAK